MNIAYQVLGDGSSPGEVLVSRTVKDLVAGSGLEFGEPELKSFPDIQAEWQLFTVKRNW